MPKSKSTKCQSTSDSYWQPLVIVPQPILPHPLHLGYYRPVILHYISIGPSYRKSFVKIPISYIVGFPLIHLAFKKIGHVYSCKIYNTKLLIYCLKDRKLNTAIWFMWCQTPLCDNYLCSICYSIIMYGSILILWNDIPVTTCSTC